MYISIANEYENESEQRDRLFDNFVEKKFVQKYYRKFGIC
jgi:hypothetical protein